MFWKVNVYVHVFKKKCLQGRKIVVQQWKVEQMKLLWSRKSFFFVSCSWCVSFRVFHWKHKFGIKDLVNTWIQRLVGILHRPKIIWLVLQKGHIFLFWSDHRRKKSLYALWTTYHHSLWHTQLNVHSLAAPFALISSKKFDLLWEVYRSLASREVRWSLCLPYRTLLSYCTSRTKFHREEACVSAIHAQLYHSLFCEYYIRKIY